MPDIWGEGALFAFSGLDGPTDVASGFVATLRDTPPGLLFHTPRRRVLAATAGLRWEPRVVTGDVLSFDSAAGELVLVWAAWHTLVGAFAEDPGLELGEENGECVQRDGTEWLSVDGPRDAMVLACGGQHLAVSFGRSVGEARTRARQGLAVDPSAVAAARLTWLRRLPRQADPRRDRLLRKCLSVMKVNALAPEGANRRLWSTPDRVPHRHMWLWDSVFHSFAMSRVDREAAWSFLAAVLDRQRDDGMVPHMMPAHEPASAITQPPLLGWGVWEHYRAGGDRDRLEWALPRLEAYLGWNLEHRDRNRNGLLEWHIEGDARCRSGESGLDNSPRFDAAEPLDAVDFSTFQAQDMERVGDIAAALGARDRAARWRQLAERTRRMIFGGLWRGGFYHDCDLAGQATPVKAVSGFLPLLLPGIPAAHVRGLLGHLADPTVFGAPFPVPSVSLDDPAFSTDMWRGATWANLNYALIVGLRRQGCHAEAQRLAAATVEHVGRHYERCGVLFEFYDARDQVPPYACDRKGPYRGAYDLRRKVDSIRDYHWTAAVTACLLLEG